MTERGRQNHSLLSIGCSIPKIERNIPPQIYPLSLAMAERVLVIGATGNIGVSAVKGALRSGRQVLAIVRNQASADKLYKHVGSSEGIVVVEADVTSDKGVKSVVDQVKAGKLPAFQHVYTCG